MGLPCLSSKVPCLIIHKCHHQHFTGCIIDNYSRSQSLLIELQHNISPHRTKIPPLSYHITSIFAAKHLSIKPPHYDPERFSQHSSCHLRTFLGSVSGLIDSISVQRIIERYKYEE